MGLRSYTENSIGEGTMTKETYTLSIDIKFNFLFEEGPGANFEKKKQMPIGKMDLEIPA